AYDRCQIGVVTAIDQTALMPEYEITNDELLYKVFRTQVDVVLPGGVAVLNADDATVASMAELCDGEVIFFSSKAALPAIVEHRRKGGRAVVVRDDKIVLAAASLEAPLVELSLVPLIEESQEHLAGILAALGAGWALGLSPELLRAGIETYRPESPAS
ncbi:MAG: cyanophycin synthetase, partial [Rhodocyclaceae bacterium]|nr:cyanophycin synthetase [Rhodocyclaceae bacterium]